MIDVGSNQFGGNAPRMPKPQPIQAPMQAPPLQPSYPRPSNGGGILPPNVAKPGFGMSSNPAGRTMPQQAFGGAPRMTPQNPIYEKFGKPSFGGGQPRTSLPVGSGNLPYGMTPELLQQLFDSIFSRAPRYPSTNDLINSGIRPEIADGIRF